MLLVLFPVFSPICLMTSLSWILLRAAGEGKFVSELTLTELSLRSLRAELNPLLLLVLLPRPTCSGKRIENILHVELRTLHSQYHLQCNVILNYKRLCPCVCLCVCPVP